MMLVAAKVDKCGYDEYYKGKSSRFISAGSPKRYMHDFEHSHIAPFHTGGLTKGYIRGEATRRLMQSVADRGLAPDEVNILDAGCGQGELSVYLACKGYNITGVDISVEGCAAAAELARRVGVADKCRFLAESLENLSVGDRKIDFIIGHAALHHFIKYEDVPLEFMRVMKEGAKGYFADSFGENKAYHVFHDKEAMTRLGDVILRKDLITNYFNMFDVELIPGDWFSMLDKLYLKLFPRKYEASIRRLSRLNFLLDRHIPQTSRVALALSGSVITLITKRTAQRHNRSVRKWHSIV